MAWAGLLVGATLALAQPAPDSSAARPAAPEELSQSELLKAYLQVRDQLHATQLAVLNNRMESEAASRAQAAALTERLEAIKVAMDAERERQRKEVERAEADRLRLQQEAEQSNRIVLWVAAAFGGADHDLQAFDGLGLAGEVGKRQRPQRGLRRRDGRGQRIADKAKAFVGFRCGHEG